MPPSSVDNIKQTRTDITFISALTFPKNSSHTDRYLHVLPRCSQKKNPLPPLCVHMQPIPAVTPEDEWAD